MSPLYPPLGTPVDPDVFFAPFLRPTITAGTIYRRSHDQGFVVVEIYDDGDIGGDDVLLSDVNLLPRGWSEFPRAVLLRLPPIGSVTR